MIIIVRSMSEVPEYLSRMTNDDYGLGHVVGNFRQDLSVGVNALELDGPARDPVKQREGNIINGLCCVAFLRECGETTETIRSLLTTDWQRVRGVRPHAMHLKLPPRKGDLWTDPIKIFSSPRFSGNTPLIVRNNQCEGTINVLMWVSPLTRTPQIWGWCYYEERSELGVETDFGLPRPKVWAVPQSKLRKPHTLEKRQPLYNLIHDPRLR